ncbi:hypothetical protein WA158_003959 [Blastocystis sp. Blastoise]
MGKKDECPVIYMKEIEGTKVDGSSSGPIYRKLNAVDGLEYGKSDTVHNLYEQFLHGVQLDEKHKCLGYRPVVDGVLQEYQWFNFHEVSEMIKNLGSAMIHEQLVPENDDANLPHSSGEHARMVGIYSRTRYEWVLAEYACYYCDAAVVTLYDSLELLFYLYISKITILIYSYIFKTTNLVTVFASGSNEIKNILGIKKQGGCEALKNIIYFDDIDEELKKESKEQGLNIYFIHDLIKLGSTFTVAPNECGYDDICTICFTSGTTSTPKGVILSHGNMLALTIAIATHYEIGLHPNDVVMGYLPLAHVFERFVEANALYNGACIGYFSGNVKNIVDDLRCLHPTVFISVPRLFNRIYNILNQNVSSQASWKQWLFLHALNTKIHNLRWNQCTHSLYDRILFKSIASKVGFDRIRWFLNGSAPLADDISTFFKCVFSAPMMNGYGMTETGGGTCCSSALDVLTVGNCGAPVTCLELKLSNVPEKNYNWTDTEHVSSRADGSKDPISIEGRGEVLLRGPGLFKGYYKEPELTKQSIDEDGWFHTGDIGYIRKDNHSIQLIDRIKNIFKLAQGEYIAVEKIENIYLLNSLVEQIFVYGDSYQSYIVGVVVPNKHQLFNLISKTDALKDIDPATSFETICKDKRVRNEVLKVINQTAVDNGLFGFERIRNVLLEPVGWTPENNILTPSLKLKRTVTTDKYHDDIVNMYAEGQVI